MNFLRVCFTISEKEKNIEELKNYNQENYIIFLSIGIILNSICLLLMVSGYNISFYVVIGILLGIGFIIWGVKSPQLYQKKLDELDANGDMPDIISDFHSGGRAFKDNLIFGNRLLIGKGTGEIIKYEDITRVYQTIHRTNFIEDGRTLTAVTSDNKTHQFCNLKVFGKSNDELEQVVGYIVSRNPSVQVGDNNK